MKWVRVSKQRPCPICDRPDWCTVSADCGLCLCMRVESGRRSKNRMGGWLHLLRDKPTSMMIFRTPVAEVKPRMNLNFEAMWQSGRQKTAKRLITELGKMLDVEPVALDMIGAAWSPVHRAWGFPMRAPDGKIRGLRLRAENGDKWAVRGSRVGLFIPSRTFTDKTLYVVEGPTDLAAALTIGLNAIARPSCMGCEDDVVEYIKLKKYNRCVVISDNDTPGIRGAQRLIDSLPVMSCMLVPPAKDLREFVRRGGDRQTLMAMHKAIVWTKPNEHTNA